MGDIATKIGQPTDILKTGSVAWTAVNGTEQVSVVIPVAYEEPATFQPAAGLVIKISLVSSGASDNNISLDIYGAADNATQDDVATVLNTIAFTDAGSPTVWSRMYRMDEIGPAIVIGLTRDAGTATLTPTLTVYRWYYSQIMG